MEGWREEIEIGDGGRNVEREGGDREGDQRWYHIHKTCRKD